MDADRDALARYLDGDERAFEELVIRYEARVRHVAYSVLRDHALAEDVAQETFLTAYRKAASFRGEGSVKSWVLRIAVRRALGVSSLIGHGMVAPVAPAGPAD